MDSTPPNADRQPCFTGRLCAEIKRLALLAIVLGLIFIAGKYYCFDRLNEEIRVRVESILRNHYVGLNVTVKSARRVAGQGVEIRGIRIAEAGGKSAPFLAEIDEIFARCDTRLPDFLTKPPQISDLKIHRLKLRAERKPSGRWNLAHLLPLPSCESAAPPVATISDATFEIIDPAQHPTGGLMLRNIELSVEPAAAASGQGIVLRAHGTLGGDHFERVEIDGSLDPITSKWDLRGSVEGLEFSPRLRAGLPNELSQVLAPLSSIRGRTFFGFHASRGPRQPGTGDPAPLEFVIHGKISEGRIDDARLPEPLTDVEATIRFDNHGLSVQELSARCGPTHIELNAPLLSYSGTEPADIELSVRHLQLEQLPTQSMPPAVRAAWDRFSPRGMADLAGRLRFDGHQWLPELKMNCRDLSVAYDRFPYRLTDGSGTIELKPSGLSVRLKLLGGGRSVGCRAEVRNPGPNFTGWVQVQSDGSIAIDENVLSAMEPAAQRVVRAFRPRGGVSFFARFSREPGESPMRRHVEINLHDCTIQHERFQYPIDRVSGTLVLDGESWTFMNLRGRNDSAEISGQGVWATQGREGRQLKLQFVAYDVPLAEELRQALPPSAQRLWGNLRPRGNLDQVSVSLRYGGGGQPWSIDIGAQKGPPMNSGEGRSISLEPAWFRYALNDVTGALRYRDGRMELSNLRAMHGHAAIAAEGNCSILPAGGCRLHLTSLAADRVQVDQELLAALPGGLGQSLDRLPLEGPVNVLGKLAIDVPPHPDARPLLSWDLDLDVENGRLLTSTPVEHLHGGMSLSGRQTSEGLFARGELKVDSAIIRGMQLTNVTGPYWFDGRQLVFGALADRGIQQGAPRQVTARVLGGLLSLDGSVQLLGDQPFDIQASLANADLAEIARQVARDHRPPTGKVFGLVHLAGNSQGTHTWNGEGKINLREADLYELPAMVQLLKLLSIQRPNSTAFTNSNIDFRIEGDDLAFDRIDFSGDAISLKGKGRMNGQRQIDLKFYPLVGREERQLAIFRPLLGQTAQEFMLIEVTGSLDQPEITRTPFPRLDARLHQIFPELARDETVEPKATRNSSVWNPLNPWRSYPQR